MENMPSSYCERFATGTMLKLAALESSHRVVALLIERNASIDKRDKNGSTPLMYACIHEDSRATLLLLNAGADLALRNHAKESVMDFAYGIGKHKQRVVLLARFAFRAPGGRVPWKLPRPLTENLHLDDECRRSASGSTSGCRSRPSGSTTATMRRSLC